MSLSLSLKLRHFLLHCSSNLPCPCSNESQGRLGTSCYRLGFYRALTLPKFQSVPFYPSRVAGRGRLSGQRQSLSSRIFIRWLVISQPPQNQPVLPSSTSEPRQEHSAGYRVGIPRLFLPGLCFGSTPQSWVSSGSWSTSQSHS